MSRTEFEQALAPNVSFKDFRQKQGARRLRGHKGVGLSYLAYGFNYIRIATRGNSELHCAEMSGARDWTKMGVGSAPLMKAATEESNVFDSLTRGTAVTIRLDTNSTPKSLPHLATTAAEWALILRSQTALGRLSIDGTFEFPSPRRCRSSARGRTQIPSPSSPPSCSLTTWTIAICPGVADASTRTSASTMPRTRTSTPSQCEFTRNHGIFKCWGPDELIDLVGEDTPISDEDSEAAQDFVLKNKVWVYGFMAYSADFWSEHRAGASKKSAVVVQPGVLLASEGMGIGDYAEISLTRYIGRQRQVACVVHIDGLRPDLGRKSFEKRVSDFAQLVSRRIVEWFSEDGRHQLFLRPSRTKSGDHSVTVDDWKFEARSWLNTNPLSWGGIDFALLSEPRQEQDVVILFSQMVAAGVLRGYEILGAAEGNQPYDSLMRVRVPLKGLDHFDKEHPEALPSELIEDTDEISTTILVVEFKYDLTDLVRDFADHRKRFGDIQVAIAWNAREGFKQGVYGDYTLYTVALPETVSVRPYPGVTHVLRRNGSDHLIHVVLLEDLFIMKRDYDVGYQYQLKHYER